jgi:cell fate (sporulation/competence/biofilm development) regulator YlbF (YheA/YmcA/DUF963 family)
VRGPLELWPGMEEHDYHTYFSKENQVHNYMNAKSKFHAYSDLKLNTETVSHKERERLSKIYT